MVHKITIETQNDTALEQIKAFARKLGLKIREESVSDSNKQPESTAQKAQPGNLLIQQLTDLEKKFPPRQVSQDFDFNTMVDNGINL